jgi:hypothetical protein
MFRGLSIRTHCSVLHLGTPDDRIIGTPKRLGPAHPPKSEQLTNLKSVLLHNYNNNIRIFCVHRFRNIQKQLLYYTNTLRSARIRSAAAFNSMLHSVLVYQLFCHPLCWVKMPCDATL